MCVAAVSPTELLGLCLTFDLSVCAQPDQGHPAGVGSVLSPAVPPPPDPNSSPDPALHALHRHQ